MVKGGKRFYRVAKRDYGTHWRQPGKHFIERWPQVPVHLRTKLRVCVPPDYQSAPCPLEPSTQHTHSSQEHFHRGFVIDPVQACSRQQNGVGWRKSRPLGLKLYRADRVQLAENGRVGLGLQAAGEKCTAGAG
ncbi:hypothetical protein GCM10007417_08670 [Glycocaulis alkaliphilus]|nr:hypothetical protein GCM10007417_08670 [Glycocaulis alkaliphilus]